LTGGTLCAFCRQPVPKTRSRGGRPRRFCSKDCSDRFRLAEGRASRAAYGQPKVAVVEPIRSWPISVTAFTRVRNCAVAWCADEVHDGGTLCSRHRAELRVRVELKRAKALGRTTLRQPVMSTRTGR
jgi:hypothetical protein